MRDRGEREGGGRRERATYHIGYTYSPISLALTDITTYPGRGRG